MTKFIALFEKEIRQYFNSPIAYIFLVAFLTFANWLFFRNFFLMGQIEMRSFFGIMPWIFLFLIPALTMRLWSEEYRQGTIETLLTSSISIKQAVLAKFTAGSALLLLVLITTLTLPISLANLGDLDLGVVLVSYLGAFLLGMAYIALGLFISAMTNNQIVAFIVSVLITFAFFIIGDPIVTFALPGFITPVLEFISIGAHYDSIIRGVIDTKDMIYLTGFIFWFLFLNIQILNNRR